MCLSRIAQRHLPADRKNELAITQVIRELTDLGGIGFCKHTGNLDVRVVRCRALKQYGGVTEGAAWFYLRDQLRCDLAANDIGNCIHDPEFFDRFIIIDCQRAGDAERSSLLQFPAPHAGNHLRSDLLRRMYRRTSHAAQGTGYQDNLSLPHVSRVSHKLISRKRYQR
jgi:hypothetical protein